jgi:molybdopterin synthase catalytic subunit
MPLFDLTHEPIDPARVLAAVRGPERGAVILFAGDVRSRNEGRRVLFLEYEAYEPMARRALAAIGEGLAARFPGVVVAIVHRLGRLEVGETSVAIAVAAPRRADAYAASREAIERLKREVPIWKKEHFEGGEVWVESPGAAAAEGGATAP